MRRAALLLVAPAVLALQAPGHTTALCAVPGSWGTAIRDAPAAFVGEVVSVRSGRRWATVDVESVWKGDVAATVEVRSGGLDPPGGLRSESSVDRSYDVGTTYLFVPFAASGDVFEDNSCTRTTRYRAALEAFRPGPAQTPAPVDSPSGRPSAGPADEDGDGGGSFPWALVAAGIAGAGLIALVGARRRKGIDEKPPNG